MSRIADVLDKARQERLRRSSADRQQTPAGPVLRSSDDIQIPWQLQGDGIAGTDDAMGTVAASATVLAVAPTPPVPAATEAAPPLPVTAAPATSVPEISAPVTVAVIAVPEPAVPAPPAPAPVAPAISAPVAVPAPASLVTPLPATAPAPVPVAAPAAPVTARPAATVPAPAAPAVLAAPAVFAPEPSSPAAPVPVAPVPALPAPAGRVTAPPSAVATAPPTPIGERPPLVVDDETAALARKLFGVADSAGNAVRRVLVCAVGTPEQSAEIAVGLGIAASRERSASVALIDLNLDGGGSLHRRLQLDGTPGISDAVLLGLKGRRNIQRVQASCDLWLIAAGSRPQDLRARLGQSETRSAIRSLAAAFDYAVGYVPAAGGDDALALGGCFDGVVLVLDAGTTAPEAARAAADAFKDGGVPLLGTIARNRPTA